MSLDIWVSLLPPFIMKLAGIILHIRCDMLGVAAHPTNLEELENEIYRGPVALASVCLFVIYRLVVDSYLI